MKRIICMTLAVLGFFVPAAHASGVRVTLRIASPIYALADKSCEVTVESGSDALAVLAAAKTARCISGYSVQTFGIGHFVDCINDGVNGSRCGDPTPTYARYWDMRVNCVVTDYGVDDYRAKNRDELSFTYESFVTSLVTFSAEHLPTDCI